MKIVIDRFEGDFAVIELEDGSFVNAPRKLFCDGREGETYCIIKDKEETKKRKKRIEDLRKRLF